MIDCYDRFQGWLLGRNGTSLLGLLWLAVGRVRTPHYIRRSQHHPTSSEARILLSHQLIKDVLRIRERTRRCSARKTFGTTPEQCQAFLVLPARQRLFLLVYSHTHNYPTWTTLQMLLNTTTDGDNTHMIERLQKPSSESL
jgi:hypothetical protein